MKLLRYSGPVILLTIGVISLGLLSMLKKDPPQKDPTSSKALVEVAPVQSCERGFDISVDGEVIPYREVNLATQVGGRIANKSEQARAGNYVSKGDLLFEIDPRDYELEVENLKESVNKALSNIKELEVERASVLKMIELAERSLDLQTAQVARLQELRNRDAISSTELDKAKMAELQDRNSVQTQKNQVDLIDARRNRLSQEIQQAETSLRLAELNLSRTKITSPIDGVVIQDFAEQDDFVQVGTRLVQLEDTSKVEARFNLRMDQLQWIWAAHTSGRSASLQRPDGTYQFDLPKIPVTVSNELAGNRFEWNATLSRYDGAGINAGTRTIPVIAVVDDRSQVRVLSPNKRVPPPTLLRGSFVGIDIPVGDGMDLVSIPATAYRPDHTVWIYDDGKLDIQPVDVAYANASTIVVSATEKLQVGSLVITTPLPVAEQGMDLRLPGENTTTTAEANLELTKGAAEKTAETAAKTSRESIETEAR